MAASTMGSSCLMWTARAVNIASRPFPSFQNCHWRESSNPKFRFIASCSATSTYSNPQRRLVLYTKPGCCLCDGLKEKLDLILKSDIPNSLKDVELQVRDITTNPEWERRYALEIPVLARILSDGTEDNLPRFSPRHGVEIIRKKLAAALQFD